MSSTTRSELLRDPYLEWVDRQGIPVVSDYGVDLLAVETSHWARADVDAAFVHLTGSGDFVNLCVLDLPSGASTSPQRHLYEEIVYVLAGRGTTTITRRDGSTHTFEWGPKSLFALPLNVSYRHFNASGTERARLASTMTLPVMLKLLHDEEAIFDVDVDLPDRLGASHRFGGGDLIPAPLSREMWETNLVNDLGTFDELREWKSRGAGGRNIIFVMADGTLHAHISEMPVGTYKKAHRHGPDFYVFAVTGEGYSLLWYDDDEDPRRVDWRHGVVFQPADQQFHQHFNTSPVPARYLATAIGSARYPFTTQQRRSFLNVERRVQDGGMQIEYADQDPKIHELYVTEMARRGVEVRMDGFGIPTAT